LPPGLKLESNSIISVNGGHGKNDFPEAEMQILGCVSGEKMSVKSLENQMGSQFSLHALRNLIASGVLALDETISEKYHEKMRAVVTLNPEFAQKRAWCQLQDSMQKAPRQKELLTRFAELTAFTEENSRKAVPKKELLKKSNVGESALKQLVNKKIFAIEYEPVSRLQSGISTQNPKHVLTEAQQKALEEIKIQFSDKQTVLLHGITASGKTEIYIHLIDETLAAGKQVLYMVPEIALTPQIINRLKNVFGNKADVYHSKMSDAERVEIWNNVLSFSRGGNSSTQIILGTRSSVFLPFANLGLIIIDEEHESSYKQFDPAPRYHARDSAIVMALHHNAKVLLGSATPSFESYFNAKARRYGLVKLDKRFSGAPMPDILIADVSDAYKRRQMKSIFTPQLYNQIAEALDANRQVVLFQNRRGYSPFIECMACNQIPRCKNCDVSLTYHKQQNRMVCHYCGYRMPYPERCPSCNSNDIKSRGIGTEKIETEIAELFPQARIERMDIDSTRSRFAFEKIIGRLENREIDILVGTQMITKGLDIEHVALAGILNADNLLNYPDFRAHERAFQLMQQVGGRSGRKSGQGKVVIQTSQPKHEIISEVVHYDYETFFNRNIAERKQFSYPPWFRLIKITVKHKQENTLNNASSLLADRLRATKMFGVLGPSTPLVGKVQQWYSKEIRLKIKREKNAKEIRGVIFKIKDDVLQSPYNKSVIIQIDVDPL
ncbi:MAG: primosomal protein N', partial [Prolixibacteraceae bacterium]|nr:primosomal protein N' [Prolixibacteraceae bacterium]